MEDGLDRTKSLSNDAVGNRLLLAVVLCFVAFGFSMLSEVSYVNEYFAVLSVILTIIIIPVTYAWGGNQLHDGREWKWFQPLQGGIRYVIFQALGWSFFALSFLLPTIPWVAAWYYPGLVIKGLTVAGGASAVLSQLLMITSLLSYKQPRTTKNQNNDTKNTKDKDDNNNNDESGRAHARMVNQRFSHLRLFIHSDSGKLWWRSFLGIQIGLVFVGLGVAVVADLWMTDNVGFQAVLGCFSLACVAVAVGVTHGVGGSWRYFYDNWQFILPGGSYIFVGLQTLGWMFFSIAILVFLLQIFQYPGSPPLMTGGVSGLVAEILLAGSLVTRGENAAPSRCRLPGSSMNLSALDGAGTRAGQDQEYVFLATKNNTNFTNTNTEDRILTNTKRKNSESLDPSLDLQVTEVSYPRSFTHYAHGVSLWVLFLRTLLVTFVYNTQNLVFFLVVINVVLADVFPKFITMLWIVGIVLYPLTFIGAPMTKGTRAVKWFQGHWMFKHIAAYFDLKIIYDDFQPLPSGNNARYIFGFHPHGIIPLTIGWACLSDLWQSIFPNIHPAALASSVLHVVPFTRDLNQMFGGYAVTRTGFLAALKRERSVVFIPGGQHEMIHSSSTSPIVVLNSRHRGFIKVALQTGAKLVPVFSFGEKNIFDNFPTPTWMQLMAMKALRANIFFLPYGQLLMSIPRQAKIRLAVGKPIDVPVIPNPSDELINMLRDHYFAELIDLCEKLKSKCDSPDTKVIVEPKIPRVEKTEWKEMLIKLKKNKWIEGGKNVDVIAKDKDPLMSMKLNHVSWTNEVTFCGAFFVIAFAVIVKRSGLLEGYF